MRYIYKRQEKRSWEQGVVSVYMALTIVIIMVASTLILTDVVLRQFRSMSDVELTERAFYAASSGFELGSYLIATSANNADFASGEVQQLRIEDNIITYEDEDNRANSSDFQAGDVVFDISIHFALDNDRNVVGGYGVCSQGQVQDAVRRLILESNGISC